MIIIFQLHPIFNNTGGVIMGDDPETSAVNNYSQMWDVENLFVVGHLLSHKMLDTPQLVQ